MHQTNDGPTIKLVELVGTGLSHACCLIIRCSAGAGPSSAVDSASDPRARYPGFDTRSCYMLLFLLPLIQEEQLSVTGESMCTKYNFLPSSEQDIRQSLLSSI